jgi:hypothetical protein
MQIQRRGDRFEGSLTRSVDGFSLPFSGVLDLVAALEAIEPEATEAATASTAERAGESAGETEQETKA